MEWGADRNGELIGNVHCFQIFLTSNLNDMKIGSREGRGEADKHGDMKLMEGNSAVKKRKIPRNKGKPMKKK